MLEGALNERIDGLVPERIDGLVPDRSDTWKLRGVDLQHGKGSFRATSRTTREALVDAVFDVLAEDQPTLIVVAIDKQAHHRRYIRPDPVEEIAYQFMLERFDAHLRRQDDRLGLVVCDQQKDLESATRRAHSRYRREGTGMQMIERVIETPFFTPSHWSRMLQVTDVMTYWAARYVRARGSRMVFHAQWERIEVLLDGYPDYVGRGLKLFPST